MLSKVISYLEGLGYRVIGTLEGSGKYSMLILEREGSRYVARFGERLSVFENHYCRQLATCPNVAASTFLGVEEGTFVAIRRFYDATLRDLISGGCMDSRLALSILLDIAKALECMHSKDLVYADLKPENVGIEEGRAVLLDTDSVCRTFAKPRFVTMDRAPPEYLELGVVLRESDIYQLGLLANEMKPLVNGFARVALEELARELMRRNPFERPSARSVRERLEELLS